MARFRNVDWDLADSQGNISTWERVGVAVMMDIRDELVKLNNLLHCENFQRIPRRLDQISRNTTKKKKAK